MIRMMIRWRARRSVRRAYTAAALLSCGASVVLAQGLAPGRWELNVAGSMYSLRANEADLSDVVSAIDAMTPADVRLRSLPDRHVSGTFHDLGLDDLLDRMDVDYVLFYDRGDAPDRAVLRRALIGLEDVPGISVTQLQRIRELIQDLHDDDVRFNALSSLDQLQALAEEAIPALEQALQYGDYQARQFAAEALCRMLRRDDIAYAPSQRFVEVLVEGMRDDAFPYGEAYVGVTNARRGYDYFMDRPAEIDRAEDALVRAIHGPDPQQRLLAALVLAEAGKTEYAGRLSQILAPHLADNQLASDGGFAARALFELGPAAWPYLEPLIDSADRQQAALVQSIIAQGLDPDAAVDQTLLAMGGFPHKNPVRERGYLQFSGWTPESFPPHGGP